MSADGSSVEKTTSRAPAGAPSMLGKVGYLMEPFLSMIDSSIVNVAILDIARSLHAALGATQWVVSCYLLAMSAGLAMIPQALLTAVGTGFSPKIVARHPMRRFTRALCFSHSWRSRRSP